MPFFLVFLAVVVAVVGAVHYYLWRRLVRDTTASERWRRIGLWVLAGLLVLTIGAFIGENVLPHAVATPLAWVGYVWLALLFYLLVGLAVLEIPAQVAKLVLRRTQQSRQRAVAVGTPTRTDAAGPPAAAPGSAAPPPTSTSGPSAAGDAQAERERVIAGSGAPASGTPVGGKRESGTYLSRRLFLGRAVALTAGVAAVGLVGTGVGTALGLPQVKRIQIPLARLPGSADGLRIALVSDIHLGPLNGAGRTRRIVDLVNDLDADLVAIVGDLVDGSVEQLGPAAAPLADLRSRHGTFFVTGNHEYFSGYEPWVEEVTRLGMRPLRNERVALPEGIDLAGVNDVAGQSYGDGPDFEAALRGRDRDKVVVLLAHQPIQAHDAARHGVDLQLSGHTHGGQMVPFNLLVRASGQPLVSGLGEVDGMPVYVTNGAGFWGPPVRVGAPPDVTLVELRTP
ncbi:MAG: metallophosphoesterase [Micromonosporaceae bacterium]|nr:metallophosphoesterase [Micromonosporaceae bacterium]